MKKLAIALLCVLSLGAFSTKNAPAMDAITAGMKIYLDKRGDLCLGKSDWPIDVTQQEMDAGARNAIQMPVLEKLGLVSSSVVSVKVKHDEAEGSIAVRRYELTEAGRKYYLSKPIRSLTADGSVTMHQGDLCPLRLSLDKVAGWEPSGNGKDIVVSYTYQVEAAPWAQNSEMQKVFPAVAYILHGAGTAQLKESFEFTGEGWRAKDL